MKATSHTRTTVTLHLEKVEAEYLRDLTQNYVGTNPEDETQEEKRIRHEVFNWLKTALDES